MSSLRELLKSTSDKERDEAADMAALQSKLKQYEQRQRRHKELMEHITSFLREEGEEEDQSVQPAMPPTRSSPEKSPHLPSSSSNSSQSQSPDIEFQAKGHVCATQVKASTPTVECFNPGFVPIQPVCTFPLYSPVSSDWKGSEPWKGSEATSAATADSSHVSLSAPQCALRPPISCFFFTRTCHYSTLL